MQVAAGTENCRHHHRSSEDIFHDHVVKENILTTEEARTSTRAIAFSLSGSKDSSLRRNNSDLEVCGNLQASLFQLLFQDS